MGSDDVNIPEEKLRLAYKKYGEGEPLIILHGLLGASSNWHTLARSVFCRYFTVYTLDQRNHGRSPHTDRIDYPTMAADLLHFLEDHGIPKSHLIGHSMGGKTAMEFALEYPESVNKLIVVDIAPKKYPPKHEEILKALKAVDLSKMDTRADIDHALADGIPDPTVRRFLLKNLSYESRTKRYEWELNLSTIHDHYERLNEAINNSRTFDGPALFVRGGDSEYIERTDEKAIKGLFPNSEFATIDNAGHWVHSDQPEAFAELAKDFLG